MRLALLRTKDEAQRQKRKENVQNMMLKRMFKRNVAESELKKARDESSKNRKLEKSLNTMIK